MNANLEMRLSQAIETALCAEYSATPELIDTLCILGLDNALIAIKQAFGFAKNEMILDHSDIKGVIAHVVDIGLTNIGKEDGLTLKEYIVVVQKIKRSVIRHSSSGPRAYYDFVRNYV